MQVNVEFWGGPKDGAKYQAIVTPTPEFICMDEHDVSMDVLRFYAEVKDHPLRTQKYHRYVLRQSAVKKNRYIYVYNGIM